MSYKLNDMKSKLIVVVLLFFASVTVQARHKDTISKGDKTYTPYELLTSYYNNNFNPFEKGKIYIGASMSLEDRTQ